MRKLLVTLDDDLSNLLEKFPNQNEVARQALRLYIGDITTDTIDGIRKTYAMLLKLNREMDAKLDFIARKVQ